MSTEATLFDMPLAHRTDPESSHIAAAEAKKGLLQAQCELVYQAVLRNPGKTSMELAEIMRVDRHVPGRRLSDLKKKGRVDWGAIRPCTICRDRFGQPRPCVTWYPTSEEISQKNP
jgi:hypothetical protein